MKRKIILFVFLFSNFLFAFAQNESDKYLETGWYYIENEGVGIPRISEETKEIVYINPKPIATAKNFKELKIYQDSDGAYGLTMKLNKIGTNEWSIATGKSIGKHLAFIFNDKLIFTPRVNAQIDFGITALNRGDLTKEELEEIKKQIEIKK